MKDLLKLVIVMTLIYSVGCKKDANNNETPIEKGILFDTLVFDGLNREYLVYIPQLYDGKKPVPLLLMFHGHYGDIHDFIDYSKNHEIAERENFITAVPQGLEVTTGKTGWNVFGFPTPDDVGFISALIDALSTRYTIDLERVYAQGFSNGAYFSYELLCFLPDKIAAIGGVAGYMTNRHITICDPGRPIPILQIHGTIDPVVPYHGVNETLNFWISNNQTSETPIIKAMPDIDTLDNSTVEHHLYADGNLGSRVEHFKVINGKHNWPGLNSANMDIDASEEIWKFVSQFDINGKID